MAKLYVHAVPPPDLNKNTEWFMYPGVWTTYILILFFAWLMVLSLFGCTPGMAWTTVNLCHFLVTYHFFHWKKGTPFAEDQGIYNGLTWWEQIDNGKQLTRNRKFLTVVPVVLYLIASHTTDYQQPVLFLNTVAVFVLVVAKFPNMHKNCYEWKQRTTNPWDRSFHCPNGHMYSADWWWGPMVQIFCYMFCTRTRTEDKFPHGMRTAPSCQPWSVGK